MVVHCHTSLLESSKWSPPTAETNQSQPVLSPLRVTPKAIDCWVQIPTWCATHAVLYFLLPWQKSWGIKNILTIKAQRTSTYISTQGNTLRLCTHLWWPCYQTWWRSCCYQFSLLLCQSASRCYFPLPASSRSLGWRPGMSLHSISTNLSTLHRWVSGTHLWQGPLTPPIWSTWLRMALSPN